MRKNSCLSIVAAILLSGIAFISCKEKNNKEYYTPREITAATDVPKYDLKLNRIDLECLGVDDIIGVDSMIVAITNNWQSQIQVFDYSGKTIAMLSPSGRAGNEFLKVRYSNQNTVIDGDRHLYVEDDDYIYLYNLSGSIRNGANLKPQKLLELPDYIDRANGFNTLFLDNGSYFQYVGVTYDEMFFTASDFTVNPDGSMTLNRMPETNYNPPTYTLVKPDSSITTFDIYPKFPDFKEDYWAETLYKSKVRLSPDGRKVVVADQFLDCMTFIDLESGDMFGVRGPDCIDLVDIAKNASPSKIVEGVWRVVTSGENIYVLYDHNTVFEEDYEEKPVNATIRVFNWNGEFIADLIPDALITKFCIDEQTGKLIAIDNNDNFYIADIAL